MPSVPVRRWVSIAAIVFVAVVSVVAPVTRRAHAQQVTPCDLGSAPPPSRVSAPAKYAAMPQQLVELQSDLDGATIQIGLVRPAVPSGVRVPVIVDASPYYHAMNILDFEACRPFLIDNYVPQGYAVALVPVRGTSNNGGCMDLMGPGERADLDQAITWLGTQPWSNGSVGMIGLSYDGSTPWEVASFGNPHLKTIVPEEGVTSLFDLMFGGGRVDWRGPGIISGIYYAESVFFYLPGRSPQHTVEVTACPEYAVGTLAGLYSWVTGEMDPFGFWAARQYLDDILESYRGSVFLIQGLQDWNVNPGLQFPWVESLADRGVYVKYLLGQWGHEYPDEENPPTGRKDFADILLGWFDRWLKGKTKTPLGPRVQVEDSTARWRNERTWPTKGRLSELWLTPDGSLASSPSSATGSVFVAPDPLHTEDPSTGQGGGETIPAPLQSICIQPVCAAFQTAPVKGTMRISWIPVVHLSVVPIGPGGGISAYLYSVKGSQWTRIGWGQADLRFPNGGREAQPVRPGQEVDLDMAIQPLDAVVPAGARLVLVLSEGNAYNRLPVVPNYPMRVQVGGSGSVLSLWLVNPKPSQFFEPPR